jgi:hypothetical protein
MAKRRKSISRVISEYCSCGKEAEPSSRHCSDCNRSRPPHLKLYDWYRPRTDEDRDQACKYPVYDRFSPWVQRAFDIFATPSTAQSGHPADERRFYSFAKIAFRLQWRTVTSADVREALLIAGFTCDRADYYAEEFARSRDYAAAPRPLEF